MKKREWASLEEISSFCRKHNLLSRVKYMKAYKAGSLPENFPCDPTQILEVDWSDIFWVSLSEFKEYCEQNGIINYEHYKRLRKEGKLPDNFPPNPSNAYNTRYEILGWERVDIKQGKKKSENKIRKIFQRIFNRKFTTARPSWLSIDGQRLELDGYDASLSLAFEYQGEYHYYNVEIHHRSRTLEDVQNNDRIKKDLCAKRGVSLVCIPYTENNNEKYLISELRKLNRIDINEFLDYYEIHKSEIIQKQIQREIAEQGKKNRRWEFSLSEDLVDAWIGIFNYAGYEMALEWVEAVEKGEHVPVCLDDDEDGTKANEGLRFQEQDKWEIIRLLEYLKSRQEAGRDTYRVPILFS